ncbi:MAG: diacylglycerol kinase family protein [Pseudomonas sp.]|uniref:diacylglycerol kinase family protein n=1 Tax=Pseudomonas sp. TaxID=306 RepID=UPI003397F5D7
MNNNLGPFSVGGRLRSLGHALAGLRLLMGQQNAWIHAVASLAVVAAGAAFRVSALEWCLLILAIMAVWVAEALNTAVEQLCDLVSPEFHPLVKKAKDVAAAAVLCSALGAVAIGLVVFLPYGLG